MKFCDICHNFAYIQLDKDNRLQYHCKNCDNIMKNDEDHSICVTENNYTYDNANYKQFINKYLKHDPTLPRVTNVACPNKNCTKPSTEPNEVIYVKYDSMNMKYMYHCVYCDHFWKME